MKMPYLNDEDTKLLEDEGMITKMADEQYAWKGDSPKFVKCPKGHWLKTHEGGDFSLLFCPKCKLNYIMLWDGGNEGHMIKTLELAKKGRATNITPDEYIDSVNRGKCDRCGKEIPPYEPIYYDVVNDKLIGFCEECNDQQEYAEDDDL